MGRHGGRRPVPRPGTGCRGAARGVRLAEIPGVSLKLAREIIAETGLDMARFPTADHLVSWGGLAPVARQSGSRQRKPSTGQGDVYLKTYCAQAANGTANTGTFLGERLRRLTRRLGRTKASVLSAGPSWSSSGIFWLTLRPGSPTSAPAGTTGRQAATAGSAATSAS
jgi:hypothetical protein